MSEEPKFNMSFYESVYSNIRTVEERGVVHAGIELLLGTLYQKGGDIGEILETSMPRSVVKPLKQGFTQAHSSVESVREYLEGLRQALDNLQILSLELAFDPAEETIAVLTTWMRKNIGEAVVMQLSTDKTLLAGVRLSFEGRYKEVNLGRIINEAIEQQPQLIQQVLES